ncbi:MAG TPA: ROK family protein, partial [Bryobacteraceae bacterium]
MRLRAGVIGAVDIGGTKIAVGAVTGSGEILGRFEFPTAPREGFPAAMGRTAEMLRELSRQVGERYGGIGVACSGPVDPLSGIVGNVGTLPGWQGSNIVTALGKAFGVPVAVENDADAAALAEATWGAAKGSSRFIYVTISTGIGGGIVFSGQLYRGVEGAHPELGHHVLDCSGPPCYCRARGCWECLASGPAMTAWMSEQYPEAGELTAAQICGLARGGDERARRAVEREGFYIGVGLANLITMFTPDTIALGGGVMKSADLFLDRARGYPRYLHAGAGREDAAHAGLAGSRYGA